jgi:phosphoglycolate phosphatase
MKAIIFDFDGTLTELTLNFDYLKEEIVKIALKYIPTDIIRTLEDSHLIETIYKIEKYMGTRGTNFQEEAFNRLESLEVEAAEGKGVYPYARGVLMALRKKGIKAGIVTRTCHAVLRRVFPDLDEYIHVVVTREDIREVKPNPAHVEKTLRILHIAPEEAMMVGDHPTDVLAGNELNMKTVGVLTGRTDQKAFQKIHATYIFKDIRGILSLL